MRSRRSMLYAAVGLLVSTSIGWIHQVSDEFAAGRAAYEAGRFEEAFETFAAEVRDAGESASPELLHDAALAALRAGALREAEQASAVAAERGGARFQALRDFVRGSVAFARCIEAEAQAKGPEAEPFAFDVAILHARSAKDFWCFAAASRDDWAEARRNAERSLVKLTQLEAAKAAAQEELRKQQAAGAQRRVELAPASGSDASDEDARGETLPSESETTGLIEPQRTKLGADEVARLFDRVVAKEREKLASRQQRRAASAGGTERDW